MSGSDLRVVVFINALPMPGYIRGSARQRGRDALSATPIFSEKDAVPLELDMDSQEERMGQKFGTGMVTTEEACRFSSNSRGSGDSVPFSDPGIDFKNGEARLLD